MTTREEILARVRSAVTGSTEIALPRTPIDPLDVPTDAEVVERFVDRIIDYRASIDQLDDAAEIAAAISAACRSQEITSLLVSDAVPAEWLTELTAVDNPAVRLVYDSPHLTPAELDRLDGVLSGCAVAVAETGTIVLDGSAAQGRRVASLVPDVHLCVVRADQLVASVPQAVARLDGTRPGTWISGGSATSDIELNRVEGVHGPRTLHVLFVR